MSLQTSKQAKFGHQAAVLVFAFGEDARVLMECTSVYLCLDFLVSPLTCMRDGARLDLETERMVYLGNHSNVVSAMNFAREQSMPNPLP